MILDNFKSFLSEASAWLCSSVPIQVSMLLQATLETLLMVTISSLSGLLIGGGLGLYLWHKSTDGLAPSSILHKLLGSLVNAVRSIPYVIFMVLLIPLTRFMTGSSIGVIAATFPLSLGAIFLFARLSEDTFHNTPKGLVEAGKVMGASVPHILRKIVLLESMPTLLAHFFNLVIMLIGFSAMAGAMGGGGLGDLALRYGYQRYDLAFLSMIVLLLICMVYIIQTAGDHVVRKLRR